MTRAITVAITLLLAATSGSAQDEQEWDVTLARGETREIDFVTDEGTWMSVDIHPDGQWVVFDLLGHVYRLPVDGGDAESLTQTSGVAVNYHPRYSPGGNHIAFISDRGGQSNLWIMNADGSEQTNLTNDLSEDLDPVFNGDGSKIVFISTRKGNCEIFEMDVDGRKPRNLSRHRSADVGPDISW